MTKTSLEEVNLSCQQRNEIEGTQNQVGITDIKKRKKKYLEGDILQPHLHQQSSIDVYCFMVGMIVNPGGGYSLCKAIRGCAALVGHFFEKIP